MHLEGKTMADMKLETFDDIELLDEDFEWADEAVKSILGSLGLSAEEVDDIMGDVLGLVDG